MEHGMVIGNLNSNASAPVGVRVAVIADAERIATLINSAFHPAETWFVEGDRINLAGVKKFLATGTFLLAESDLGLLGCVYVETRLPVDPTIPGRSYLGLLSVDPGRQQSGLGTVLMAAAEEYCRERGASVMEIKVVNLREALFSFYRKRGYIEIGTSPFPAEVATKIPCHFIEMSKQLSADAASE